MNGWISARLSPNCFYLFWNKSFTKTTTERTKQAKLIKYSQEIDCVLFPAGEKQQHGRGPRPLPQRIWHRCAQRHDRSDGPRSPGAHVAVRRPSEHWHRKGLWQGEYRALGFTPQESGWVRGWGSQAVNIATRWVSVQTRWIVSENRHHFDLVTPKLQSGKERDPATLHFSLMDGAWVTVGVFRRLEWLDARTCAWVIAGDDKQLYYETPAGALKRAAMVVGLRVFQTAQATQDQFQPAKCHLLSQPCVIDHLNLLTRLLIKFLFGPASACSRAHTHTQCREQK